MQMVKKTLILLAVIWLALLVLMPKKELYFKLEQTLAQQGIKINEKSIDEGMFTLTLNESDVYAKGIKIASIEKTTFFTLLFYTKVELDKLQIDESLQRMLPTQIEVMTLSHAVWNPVNVSVHAQGAFGAADGAVSLSKRSVRLDLNQTQGIEMFKGQLKQDEKGWYYETSF